MNKSLFSSNKMDWETPQDFFDMLNDEFNFTLDACASPENAKCKNYYTKEDNSLTKNWGGQTVFCNPPYGRQISKFVEKAYKESKKPNTTVVMLIPSRTETKWFHEYIYHKAEIRFIKGRLRFSGSNINAPFPNMVVVFNKEKNDNT